MNKKSFDFLMAYAEVYNLNNKPFLEVLEATLDFLNSDEFMENFLLYYKMAKHYGLMPEVKLSMKYGYNFWEACAEWDCAPYYD